DAPKHADLTPFCQCVAADDTGGVTAGERQLAGGGLGIVDELFDLVRGGLTRRVAGEPFLARLPKTLRPTVVQVLIDPFLAAQLSNTVLAAQAFQHDADLLFSGMMPVCGSANILDCLFSALRYALARLSHRCSSAGLR